MKKIILITLLIILSSCRNSITLVENISDTSDLEYALEIDEANPQNMEEALKRYAADHNEQYKLIFTGTSTKKYDIWTSISQMLEKISLKNIKIEISLDNVIFPNNKIPDNLFGANAINKSIVKITFPDTITEIGEYSFYCPELTEITLPSNLITIGNRGLIGCYNLKSLKLPNSLKTIGELALKECGFSSIEIPDSVTSIGKSAFGDCENLVNVKLPNNLETIPDSMFESCGSLNTITIPASVKTIEKFAFYYSKNFESIRFLNDNPASITVGVSVFAGCPLQTVYIPASSSASDAEWRNTLGIDAAVNIIRE
ncbi:leucine-rich repeat domain-containing protein [Brachyspira intermedia]|uniref:leucine-rich repeat domain-containing protein n=1 Tax=Brachyspira intermedia TaxID=84377 RepID=UPI003007883B